MTKNDKIPELTNKEFESFIKDDKHLVLIDFFAEWCLAPGTKLTFNPHIGNIESVFQNSKVLSFDKDLNEKNAKVKSTFNIVHNKKIHLKTKRGREIECTPEHLILTDKGFKKAENLKEQDRLSIYPFNTFPSLENDTRIFLNEEKIRENADKFNLNKNTYINDLREKGLLNLKYNEEKAYILANLLGFLLTDGSVSIQNNNERNIEFFIAHEKDKELLLKDLKYLGFEASTRDQEIKGKINEREFIQKITRVRITKTSFFLLMNTLGAIEGKKFLKGLKIPKWILEGPKQIKKAFLQGFLGGDGPKVDVRVVTRDKYKPYNKVCINPIELHFYEKSENDIQNFADELSLILKSLGVDIRKVEIKKEDRYERKDKKVSILLKVSLNTNLKSAYNYCLIGFKYAYSKNLTSSLSREYIRERLAKFNERDKKRQEVLAMQDTPLVEIVKKVGVPYAQVKRWLNGEKTGNSKEILSYDLWLKTNCGKNNILYDEVKTVVEYTGEQYPFISISLDNDTKIFVANDIIHHNCMPCLTMAPVLEELSEKFKGKVKFGKVNVGENQEISQKFKISSIPNFVLFKNGKQIDQFVGALSGENLEEKINSHL